MLTNEPIWVLESDVACLSMYHQTLGLQYPLKIFATFEAFAEAFRGADPGHPRLLIVEPEEHKAAITNFFSGFLNPESATHFPQTMIVSRNDDIDLMRFFMRVGVKDYILKPIRPNELVAKVERALQQINSRSILIFRNELDGQQVTNLTFREHQILTVLLNKPARTCPRDIMLDAVWNKTQVNRKTLDVHVFNLRRKLRPMGAT
ncbi:MAG: hypothetical protein EOP05_06005 [Proteobacteria bacterium]|nr:MAG: hypothetical protein EOP05_06005 [Pseudomonadota bacterium]